MHTSIYLFSFVLVPLHIKTVTADPLASLPNTSSSLPWNQKLPQRPISFSPASQHPILSYSSVCAQHLTNLPSRAAHSKYSPVASTNRFLPPFPIYLGASITEYLYLSKFVLSLSLKLSPIEPGLRGVGTPECGWIKGLLEQSA
jgi:hypothetical protein